MAKDAVTMIKPEQVFLAVKPIDMRWGMERLAIHVQHHLNCSPSDGRVYAFTNQQRSRLKLLVWDGNGIWLCQRRLHKGVFVWPTQADALAMLSADGWQYLISGIDWQRIDAKLPSHWRV